MCFIAVAGYKEGREGQGTGQGSSRGSGISSGFCSTCDEEDKVSGRVALERQRLGGWTWEHGIWERAVEAVACKGAAILFRDPRQLCVMLTCPASNTSWQCM